MNDTPQGDGNLSLTKSWYFIIVTSYIRMNDTPQGDGNSIQRLQNYMKRKGIIRMNDTPQGDGN